MAVRYKLETFEGPLDLLLHLIERAEIDIYDIPIAEITDQYIAYLEQLEYPDLETTSEFLVMASTLLSIKSRMLLPKPPAIEPDAEEEEGEDPREELVQKLIEYRKYKMLAAELQKRELERSLFYSREPMDLTPYLPEAAPNPLDGLYPADLLLAFHRLMSECSKRNAVATIRRDEISVKDKIRSLLHLLRARKTVLFSRLFDDHYSRAEIVATFLALLEMIKHKWVTCYQHRLFDEIVIRYRGEGNEDGIWGNETDY